MQFINTLLKTTPRYWLFGIILLVAAIRRFALPSVPFCDGDLFGYFLPAVRLIEDNVLSHEGTRSFVYPLFIAGLMKLWGSVTIIPFVQHLLGLYTGYLLFSIFELPLFRALRVGLVAGAVTIVQLLCCSYYLLINSVFQYEHFISSQSISSLLLVGQIYLLVKMIGSGHDAKKTLRQGSAIIFMALITYILTPRMGFALPLMGLLVLLEYYHAGITIKKWILPVIIPTAIFIIAIWVPERYLVKNYDSYTDEFPFRQFFYIHADMAKTLIKQDIENNNTEYSTEILQQVDSLLPIYRERIQYWKYLGFNADTLLLNGYDLAIRQLFIDSGYHSIYFILDYDKRILTDMPGTYALKVLDQMQHFYLGTDSLDRYYVAENIELSNNRSMTLDMTSKPEMQREKLPLQFYHLAQQQLTDWRGESNFLWLNDLYHPANRFYVRVVILFALLQCMLLFIARSLPSVHKQLLRVALYMLLIQLALVLSVAAIHSFDIYRYGIWIVPAEIMAYGAILVGIANSVAIFTARKTVK